MNAHQRRKARRARRRDPWARVTVDDVIRDLQALAGKILKPNDNDGFRDVTVPVVERDGEKIRIVRNVQFTAPIRGVCIKGTVTF